MGEKNENNISTSLLNKVNQIPIVTYFCDMENTTTCKYIRKENKCK